MNLRTLRQRFRVPPSIHAPWIGWAWNGALDDERLGEQVEALARAGFGGVAIYPHEGLTAGVHSSPGWFEHVAAIARRVRRTTLSIHLRESLEGSFAAVEEELCYDHPEACLTELTVEEFDGESGDAEGGSIAIFRVDATTRAAAHRIAIHGRLDEPSRVTRSQGAARATGGRHLVFRTRTIPNRLNYLDRRAAELFLQTVPQHLATHARRVLGRNVTGLYIDGIGLRITPGALPWDPDLEVLFRDTAGYSLIDSLPSLFYDLPGFERVRYDYWTTINDMLREGLATPIKEWCQEHKLRFGLSLRPLDRRDPALIENALLPVERVSDDFALRIPYDVAERGFENPAAFAEWLVAIKRVCSHAEQHGMPLQSAVSIGCETPTLDFDKAAALGYWLMQLGAQTVIFERLAYRTDRHSGELSLNDEESYWPVVETLNAALARVNGAMRQGRRVVDVVVLYPSTSLQSLYAHPLHASAERQVLSPDRLILRHLAQLSVALHEAEIDFHTVLERSLQELGLAEHRLLHVGEQRYRAVIVPPSVNMRSETVELLQDFVTGGGTVLFAGAVPYLVDGKPSDAVVRMVETYELFLPNRSDVFDYRPVVDALRKRKLAPAREQEALHAPMICRRRGDEVEVLFAFNAEASARRLRLEVSAGFDGHVERWEPRTGEMAGVAACKKGEALPIEDEWQGYEARVYVAVHTAYREPSIALAGERTAGPVPIWTATRTAPNALEFTSCRVMGGYDDEEVLSVEEARAQLHDALASAGRAIYWRSHWRFEAWPEKGAMSCTVLVSAGDVEDGHHTQVKIDGESIGEGTRRWYRGREYAAYEAPALSAGPHQIEWGSGCRVPGDFVSPVLLGEFAVRSAEPVAIVPAGKRVEIGAWIANGLCFYAGAVTYRGTWTILDMPKTERMLLMLRGLRGVALVQVNGYHARSFIHSPYECDITRLVKRGENVIEVSVMPEPGHSGADTGLAEVPLLMVERLRNGAGG